MSFVQELQRRQLFRVAIAYLALAWLLIEVTDTLFPAFGIPGWAFRFMVIALVLGFVPVLIFSWAFEITPEGVKREREVMRDAATEQRTARRLDGLTIGLIVVALAFITVDWLWLGSRPPASEEPAVDSATEPASTVDAGAELPSDSIAVLPFANRSANPDDVFFVDGIHDDLLTHISQIGSLKVISRTSVMEYRDTLKKIPQIARELDVAHVLEGGVQRAGDQVRINVQLIDARTDNHLWSQIYDRELTAANVFAIQSEIAQAIAGALLAELTPEFRERLNRVPTENLEALEEYFLGRQRMATRTIADLVRAAEHFESAISLDRDFALAYVGLANSIWLHTSFAGIPPEETHQRIQAAAQKALNLDPVLGEAYTVLANTLRWVDEDGAETAYRRALELSPNDAETYQWYGWWLLTRPGRLAEGMELIHKAMSLDPRSAIIVADYGDALERAGRLDEALDYYEKAIEIEPKLSFGYWKIAELMIKLGKLDEAISTYRKAVANDPGQWKNARNLGSLYLSLGDDRQAESWFSLALEQAPRGMEQLAVSLGELYFYRGEKERAMTHFDSAAPGNPEALYYSVNLHLAEGDIAGALARYDRDPTGLLENDPVVNRANYVAAIQLAVVYSWSGETERMERLLDLAVQEIESYRPRHYSEEAAIHAQRGDIKAALDALKNMNNFERVGVWRERVVGNPAFRKLLEDSDFQALDEEFEADMARQLSRVRELEASGELAPVPNL